MSDNRPWGFSEYQQPPAAGPMSNVPAPVWPGNVAASPQEIPPKPLPVELQQELIGNGLQPTHDGLILLWNKKKEQLADATADEMRLRKLVVEYRVQPTKEGTNTVDLGNGYALKAVCNNAYNFRVAQGKRDKIESANWAIAEIVKADNQDGNAIADRIFKYDITVSLTEYRRLCEDAKLSAAKAAVLRIVNECLEIKPKAPTLEIKAPKAKGKR